MSAAVQADGKILLVGYFTSVNGQTRNRIARLNADGTVESTATFNPGTGANGDALSVALQADGKILLGGAFTSVNGQPRNYIARLNANGTVESTATFNPGSGVSGVGVYSVAVQADGKILLGGVFSTVNGQPRTRIARLNADGTVEDTATFNPGSGTNSDVRSVVVQVDGKILLGGVFTTVNGQPRGGFARLNSDGTLESTATFNPGTGANDAALSVAVQADGKVLLGGAFTSVNGQPRNHFARLINDPATQSLTIPARSRVQWARGGAAPEVEAVLFELSTNGGASFTPLGPGARIAGGWECTGLSLPASGSIRARGRTVSGTLNGSSGLVEQIAAFNLNMMPVANGDTVELPMDHFNVKANDTDGDLDPLTVTGVGAAAHGTATLHGDNTVSYTPDVTFAGTDTFTYTISDGFGGTAIGTVTVRDTTAPVVVAHANMSVPATSAAGAVVTYAPGSATDAVGVTSITYSQNSGTLFPLGVTPVTITARDAANNMGTTVFLVTVTAPAAGLPIVDSFTLTGGARSVGASLHGQFTEQGGVAWSGRNAFRFSADGRVTVPLPAIPGGVETRIMSVPYVPQANDVVVLEADVVPPYLNNEGPGVFSSIGFCLDPAPYFDLGFYNQIPGGQGLGQLWMLLAKDGSWNIFASHNTPVASGGAGSAPGFLPTGLNRLRLVYDGATNRVSANINGVPVVTNQPLGAFVPTIRRAGFMFHRVDGAALDNFSVNVSIAPPNTPPTLGLPGSPIIAEATGPTGAVVTFTATANDAEDGPLTPTITPASGSTFALGDTLVNVSATDSGSLTTSGSFIVRVRDTTAPVVAAHGNVSVPATSAAGATVTYAAGSATDAVGVTSITYSQNSGTVFPIGTTTVTITARDAANNAGTGSFNVTVTNNAPVVTLTGANPLTFEAAASYTDPGATATDVEDGVLTPSITSNTVVSNVPGTYAVTWSATDSTNATGSATRVVNVVDTTAPVVAAHGNVTVEATSAAGATVTYAAGSASDAVGVTSLTYSQNSGTVFPIGTTTVTITARDAANNVGTGSFNVTVQDTTAPVFDPVPADRSVKSDATGDLLLPDFAATASATDAVSSSVTITQSPAPGTAYVADDQVSVTLTAKDAANNESTAVFIVTVTQGNRAPTANVDRALVYNASTLVDVLANDTDPDNDTLTITDVTSPASGGEVVIAGNKIRFTPDATFTSTTPVTFDYTATDGEFSSTSSVTIYHTPDKSASFAALLSDASGKPRGLFKFNMFLGGTGTGNLIRDGKNTIFRANLVDASVVVPAFRATPAITISFPMIDIDSADKPVLGIHVLSATGEALTGTARVSPYDATHAAPQSSTYTLAVTGTSPEIAAALYGSVSPKGAVRFVGKLGNYASASFSGQVLANGEVPFYMGVAKGTKANALGGTLTIGTGAAPQISGTLKWNLPAAMDARLPAGVSADYTATGARYDRLSTGSSMLTLNAARTVTEDFHLPLSTPINLSVDGTVGTTILPSPIIILAPKIGTFSCARFTLLTEATSFYGIMLQGTGLNYGVGILRSKTAIGTVDITPKP